MANVEYKDANGVARQRKARGAGTLADPQVAAVDVDNWPAVQPVSVTSLPLPAGAATETKLEAIRELLAGVLAVDVDSLPLAAGAATDTKLEAIRQLLAGVLAVTVGNWPNQQTIAGDVGLVADARQGALASGLYTLSATPGTFTSIAIPDTARGFIAEASAAARFAVGEDPAAEGAGALAVGGRLKATTETVRILAAGTGRTLRLRSTTASASVYVEFF